MPRSAWFLALATCVLAACEAGDGAFVAAARAAGGAADAPQPAPSGESVATAPRPDPRITTRAGVGQYDLGDYIVYGEVRNGSDAPIHDVELTVSFHDASGEVVAESDAAPALARVDSGVSAPIMKTQYAAPEGIVRTSFRVSAWRGSGTYHPLDVSGVRAQAGRLGMIVTGTGRNGSGHPLASPKLVAAFRDAQDRVVGVAFDYPVHGVLRQGAAFDFTIETFDGGLDGSRVQVLGEGTGRP